MTKLTLQRFIPYRLSILSNRVSSLIASTYQDKFALSVTEWRIIAVLAENPGASGEQVSVKTQIEKSILSRAIQKLLNRHLILRSTDHHDRRKQNLSLSHLGKDIYKQVAPLSLQHEQQLLACFSDKEKETFRELIDRLNQHADKLQL